MKNSDLGAKAPKVKDDFKKQQPIAGSKHEVENLRKQLNKPLTPSPNLTIGGFKEKASHETHENKTKDRIQQIEVGLERTSKRVQLKSRFNGRSRTRSRS